MHLPPRHIFSDYYTTIKKPISYAEIKAKIDRGEYQLQYQQQQQDGSAAAAGGGVDPLKAEADDFHQMFVNAKRYNQKGSSIWNDAKRLDVGCVPCLGIASSQFWVRQSASCVFSSHFTMAH